MKKASVEKMRIMAQDFLQYRYQMFCNGRRDADWNFYNGACAMITAFGGEWKRFYDGDDTEGQKNDASKYSHLVWFPDDAKCEKLNEDAWK